MSEAAAALEGAAGEQQQDQQQQQNAPAAWLEGLSDDLKSNADLVRMGSIEDLAKGYVETRAWAKGRVAIPSAEADDSAWQEFGAKLRPEKPEAYEIAVPEGQDTALAEQFRVFAYETGIPPRWVKAIAEFNNRAVADQVSAVVGRNQAEVESLQIELGPEAFEVRKQAVNAMFSAAGLGDGEGFAGAKPGQRRGAESDVRAGGEDRRAGQDRPGERQAGARVDERGRGARRSEPDGDDKGFADRRGLARSELGGGQAAQGSAGAGGAGLTECCRCGDMNGSGQVSQAGLPRFPAFPAQAGPGCRWRKQPGRCGDHTRKIGPASFGRLSMSGRVNRLSRSKPNPSFCFDPWRPRCLLLPKISRNRTAISSSTMPSAMSWRRCRECFTRWSAR
jgi:hypothetical protein